MSCIQRNVRTSSVLICCTYLVFHAAFLVINFIIISDTESHLVQIATYTDIENDDIQADNIQTGDAETLMLFPILVNVFLILSNVLAGWGAITYNHLFLIPWLASYFSYILFAFGLLLYMVIVLHQIWFKIVIFLIVSPILILAIVFWLTLLELYFNIKIMTKRKQQKHFQNCKMNYPTITSSKFIPPTGTPAPAPIPPPLPPTNSVTNKVNKKPSFLDRHRPLFKRNGNRTQFKHRSYRKIGTNNRKTTGKRESKINNVFFKLFHRSIIIVSSI